MKKNLTWSALLLLIIVVAAFFVRIYKFDEWLYFKMDQSRDAFIVSEAVNNGPQYLPLLGPRAGAVQLKHGFLMLGPIYYYFQYISGVIFHSVQPYVYAYPDLFFSILTIPLLYFLAKLYFSKRNSLLITAMYAFSFIIIQYSRFAWNPNSLQFFLLLSFYGLLKFLNEPYEKRKKWWLALWAIGMIIGSQLHFFGFFSLLGISGLLIIFHFKIWKKENIIEYVKKDALKRLAKYAGIVAIIFAIFYTPVIISEVYKNGRDTKNFIEALSSKQDNKPLQQKIIKSAKKNLEYYCLITTSQCYEIHTASLNIKEEGAIVITVLILLAGLILVIRKLRQKIITVMQKDFLIMLIMWVGVFSVLTIPVSFQLRPRFFIVVFAIPFISLGLLFEYLDEKIKKKYALIVALFLTAGIVAWNSYGTYAWFKEQATAQKELIPIKRTLILKSRDGVTLGQMQKAADWIYNSRRTGTTLYYYAKQEYVRPIDFLLWEKQDKNLIVKNLELNEDPTAQFFAIMPAADNLNSIYKKYGKDNVSLIAQQQFGQLMAYEIDFPGRITSDTFKVKRTNSSENRVFWKDVFNIKNK